MDDSLKTCTAEEIAEIDCKNGGLCEATWENQSRRLLCNCANIATGEFGGEQCEEKYNDLIHATKYPAMMLPWYVILAMIVLALAVCLLIGFFFCYYKLHQNLKTVDCHNCSFSRTDPEIGYVRDSGCSPQQFSENNEEMVTNGYLNSNGNHGNLKDTGACSGVALIAMEKDKATSNGNVVGSNTINNNNLGVRDNNKDSITSL